MLAVAPVVCFCAFTHSRDIKPAFINVREQFSNLNSVCAENIGGNRVVKAFAREEHEIDKFSKANQAYYESNTRTSRVWAKYNPVIETCAAFLPFISLFLGSLLIIWGKMELWQLIMFNGYLWMINNPTRMFGMFVNDTQNSLTSLEKIFNMMRRRIRVLSPENPAAAPEAKGVVEFENVSFGYDRHDPGNQVLKDISFRAETGWTVGIVGPTGAGKTT
jgi:ATP-binding cassette subfamily B protein